MTISNHQTILQYLESLKLDPFDFLEGNKLEDFSKCKINSTGAVMHAETGRILRGSPSPNKAGRSKTDVAEEKESNKTMVNLIQSLMDSGTFDPTVNTEEMIRKISLGILAQCKTVADTKEWFKLCGQYHMGKKQTIESDQKEERRIIISFGSPETTDLIKNITPSSTIKEVPEE